MPIVKTPPFGKVPIIDMMPGKSGILVEVVNDTGEEVVEEKNKTY
jgi:hypothetical protein